MVLNISNNPTMPVFKIFLIKSSNIWNMFYEVDYWQLWWQPDWRKSNKNTQIKASKYLSNTDFDCSNYEEEKNKDADACHENQSDKLHWSHLESFRPFETKFNHLGPFQTIWDNSKHLSIMQQCAHAMGLTLK